MEGLTSWGTGALHLSGDQTHGLLAARLAAVEIRETSPDERVTGVQLQGAVVGVAGIVDLVVARLVQRPKVIPAISTCQARALPDFGNVGVEPDRPAVRIQRVTELVDLVVQYTDRAPERRVATIAVARVC